MDSNNKQLASSLIGYCAEAVDNTHRFGRLTSSIYDTAWVSVLRNPHTTGQELLFPECYKYILDQQHPGSGWEKSPESEIDGIICTLGGLFALITNSDIPMDDISPENLESRKQDGVAFLNSKLQTWDVASCDHVGFEIIIPCMFERLEQKGYSFTFPGQTLLTELYEKKMSKIHPAVWSGKVQTTITHSLEAFLGKADFSGLRDQRVCGGMGSSPSSTAAYLMWSPVWDHEAEQYLRTVLASRWSDEVGGVPGMYPTTGFEVLWIASTLLEDGFDAQSLPGIEVVLSIIREFHDSLDGLASGFSKSSVPDADDTSKSIILCNLLGIPTDADKLVKKFEGKDHFLTYMMERHPSVTTNCNVLSALLVSPEPEKFVGQIEKCAKFLCASWMQSEIPFQDKWNVSEFYPVMLLSQALCRLVHAWDRGLISDLSTKLLTQTIGPVLFQVLMQTLQKQNTNGSWGHISSKEITAYAIIALGNLASMPFGSQFVDIIQDAINNGRAFINSTGLSPEVEYVWIAKSNYSPVNISKAYILAALKLEFPKYSLSPSFSKLLNLPSKSIQKYTHIFSSLPTLRDFPLWRIEGSITEAFLFLDELRSAKLNMFDRAQLKQDEYFEFIAVALACSNNLHGTFLKTDILLDMMSFILHVYEVDEYFEHVIGIIFENRLPEIRRLITQLLETRRSGKRKFDQHESTTNGNLTPPAEDGVVELTNTVSIGCMGVVPETSANSNMHLQQVAMWQVSKNLESFIGAILDNPAVQRADAADRRMLEHELHRCLLAHVTQIEDSKLHYQSLKAGSGPKTPASSYHEWVRTNGAAHSCSPLSLAFFRCLIPQDVAGRQVSAVEQYLMQDLWIHFANKARMENDRSSIRRDRHEENLNSMDFPEFNGPCLEGTTVASTVQLTQIIEHENKCCKVGLEALENILEPGRKNSQLEALKFYYFLLELYNDVYILKDISSGRKD